MLLALTILFMIGIAWWSTHREKKQLRVSYSQEADDAMRTVRKIAHKRANQASIPIPMSLHADLTPIMGVPLTPAREAPLGNGRAPTSQPYAQHNRKGNNLKIVKR